MVFLEFLAGAAIGGLAGYALGASRSPWYWPAYYSPVYYPMPMSYYQPYPYFGYARPYAWNPWYGYW